MMKRINNMNKGILFNHPGGPFTGQEWGGAVSKFAIKDPLAFAGHISRR